MAELSSSMNDMNSVVERRNRINEFGQSKEEVSLCVLSNLYDYS